MRRSTWMLATAALAGATMFGGVLAAQSGDGDNRDVPSDDRVPVDDVVPVGPAPDDLFESTSRIYNVPAAAFTPDGANPDSLFFPFSAAYFRGDSQNYGCMVAPVHLPQGARLNTMTAIVGDDDVTYNADLSLRRLDKATGATKTIARAATSGASPDIVAVSDSPTVDNIIDNEVHSYFFTTCLQSGNIRLAAVELHYQEEVDTALTDRFASLETATADLEADVATVEAATGELETETARLETEVDAVDARHSPVLVPVTPFRAYDSRREGGPLAQGQNRRLSVLNRIDIETGEVIERDAIPQEATAIMFNLAITNTVAGGFVAVAPGDATELSSASINWTESGQAINNGTFVELGENGEVRVFVDGLPGAQTNFIIDITGYVLPAT